jgi:hypothetical protein
LFLFVPRFALGAVLRAPNVLTPSRIILTYFTQLIVIVWRHNYSIGEEHGPLLGQFQVCLMTLLLPLRIQRSARSLHLIRTNSKLLPNACSGGRRGASSTEYGLH